MTSKETRGARSRYWALFIAETAAMLGFIGIGLPLYHRLLSGPAGERPGAHLFWIGLPLVAAMQAAYWTKRRFASALRLPRHHLLGHLLLFVSRLTFVFVGSWFTVVFLVRSWDTKGWAPGIALFLAAVFSVFCYSLELERLARTCMGRETSPAE